MARRIGPTQPSIELLETYGLPHGDLHDHLPKHAAYAYNPTSTKDRLHQGGWARLNGISISSQVELPIRQAARREEH